MPDSNREHNTVPFERTPGRDIYENIEAAIEHAGTLEEGAYTSFLFNDIEVAVHARSNVEEVASDYFVKFHNREGITRDEHEVRESRRTDRPYMPGIS